LCLYIVYTLSFSPFLLRSYDHYDLGRAPCGSAVLCHVSASFSSFFFFCLVFIYLGSFCMPSHKSHSEQAADKGYSSSSSSSIRCIYLCRSPIPEPPDNWTIRVSCPAVCVGLRLSSLCWPLISLSSNAKMPTLRVVWPAISNRCPESEGYLFNQGVLNTHRALVFNISQKYNKFGVFIAYFIIYWLYLVAVL